MPNHASDDHLSVSSSDGAILRDEVPGAAVTRNTFRAGCDFPVQTKMLQSKFSLRDRCH